MDQQNSLLPIQCNSSKEGVRKFHLAFQHPVRDHLTVGTLEERKLRVKLILEEALELAHACGLFVVVTDFHNNEVQDVRVHEATHLQPDIVEMADALGDLDYVVQGSNLVFGIPSEYVFAEIQASNMSKLGEDGQPVKRDDGKVLKGPNYFKPNINKVLHDYAAGYLPPL